MKKAFPVVVVVVVVVPHPIPISRFKVAHDIKSINNIKTCKQFKNQYQIT